MFVSKLIAFIIFTPFSLLFSQETLINKPFAIESFCYLLESPHNSIKIKSLDIGDTVRYLAEHGFYYKVLSDNAEGYIPSPAINEGMRRYKNVQHRKEIDEEIERKVEENERAEKAKKERLLKKYGKKVAKKLIDGELWLGMSDDMILDSRGEPNEINRSVGAWGVNEQWVYDNAYLYFENGKLTGWQD